MLELSSLVSRVAALIDLEESFLSAFFADPIAGYNAAIEAPIAGEVFTNSLRADLFVVLAARAEHYAASGQLLPARWVRLALEQHLGQSLVIEGGLPVELHGILVKESSGVGCRNYAHFLARAYRKRQQIRRLWRVLSAHCHQVIETANQTADQAK